MGPAAEARLAVHLRQYLGAWPPTPNGAIVVVGSERREQPGWDGRVRPFAGVETPDGAVLSVAPSLVDTVRSSGSTVEEIGGELATVLDRPDWTFGRGVFRCSDQPTTGDDPGIWLPTTDPRVPAWLHPFNGDVLVGFDGDSADGVVAAGVGRKIHDDAGHELAVVTEEGHRGQGWARRLVTQAARQVLSDGAIPIYLHAEDNLASARTADASGFPDLGWRMLGLFPGSPS